MQPWPMQTVKLLKTLRGFVGLGLGWGFEGFFLGGGVFGILFCIVFGNSIAGS